MPCLLYLISLRRGRTASRLQIGVCVAAGSWLSRSSFDWSYFVRPWCCRAPHVDVRDDCVSLTRLYNGLFAKRCAVSAQECIMFWDAILRLHISLCPWDIRQNTYLNPHWQHIRRLGFCPLQDLCAFDSFIEGHMLNSAVCGIRNSGFRCWCRQVWCVLRATTLV